MSFKQCTITHVHACSLQHLFQSKYPSKRRTFLASMCSTKTTSLMWFPLLCNQPESTKYVFVLYGHDQETDLNLIQLKKHNSLLYY